MDDDLDDLMRASGIDPVYIDPYEHYRYEDEQPLEPYDGIEDFDDHFPPLLIAALWALGAVIVGVVLLLG